jgi:putative hydrolase of the HAD superfamily
MENILSRTNGYKVIFFDLDGTLRHSVPSAHDAFFDLAVGLGVPDSIEGRRKAYQWAHYYWASSKDLAMDVTKYDRDSDEFWTNFAKRYLLAFGHSIEDSARIAEDLHHLMVEKYDPQDVIHPETSEVLQSLTTAGYRLGIITNRHQPVDDYLREVELISFFELTIAAGEIGIWKPEKGIFQHALKALAIAPDEAVYIGDNYYADVVGAKAAGILPILIDPEDIFKEMDCETIRSLGEIQERFIRHS